MEDKIKKLVELAIQEQHITPDLAERYSERIAKVIELDKSGSLRDDLDLIYIGKFGKELMLSFFEEIIRLADKTDKGEVWAIERNKSIPDPKLKEVENDLFDREHCLGRETIKLWVEEAADMGECEHEKIPFYTACIYRLIAGEKERGIIRDPAALVKDGNGWFRVPLNIKAFREYKRRVDLAYYGKPSTNKKEIPEEFLSDCGNKILSLTIEKGLCDSDYNWKKSTALWGYYVDRVSDVLRIRYSNERIKWKPFQLLFGMDNQKQSTARQAVNDYRNKQCNPPEGDDIVNQIIKS